MTDPAPAPGSVAGPAASPDALPALERRAAEAAARLERVVHPAGWYRLRQSFFIKYGFFLTPYIGLPILVLVAMWFVDVRAARWGFEPIDRLGLPLFITLCGGVYLLLSLPLLWLYAKDACDPRRDMERALDEWHGRPADEEPQRRASCEKLCAEAARLAALGKKRAPRKLLTAGLVYAVCLMVFAGVVLSKMMVSVYAVPMDWKEALATEPRSMRLEHAPDFHPGLDVLESFTVHRESCGRIAWWNGQLCGLRLQVPLRRGETFRFASPSLPAGSSIDMQPIYRTTQHAPGRLVTSPAGVPTLEYEAPYDGWFDFVIGVPLRGQTLSLPTTLGVAPPGRDGAKG